MVCRLYWCVLFIMVFGVKNVFFSKILVVFLLVFECSLLKIFVIVSVLLLLVMIRVLFLSFIVVLLSSVRDLFVLVMCILILFLIEVRLNVCIGWLSLSSMKLVMFIIGLMLWILLWCSFFVSYRGDCVFMLMFFIMWFK